MRTEFAALALAAALAGCASAPAPVRTSATAPRESGAAPCVPPASRSTLCGYPADVRAFVEDRDACDHFRGEPWPEGDGEADRTRRRELVEGARTACAGTDRRLADLRARYRDDARVIALLAPYEERVGD